MNIGLPVSELSRRWQNVLEDPRAVEPLLKFGRVEFRNDEGERGVHAGEDGELVLLEVGYGLIDRLGALEVGAIRAAEQLFGRGDGIAQDLQRIVL